MTNTYDEYADKAAASYLQGRMDEQGAWVEAVTAQRDRYRLAARSARRLYERRPALAVISKQLQRATRYEAQADALVALLRRMGAE